MANLQDVVDGKIDPVNLSDAELMDLEAQAAQAGAQVPNQEAIQPPQQEVRQPTLREQLGGSILDNENLINLIPDDAIKDIQVKYEGKAANGFVDQDQLEYDLLKRLPEANLGVQTRFKFGLEPLKSNRLQLLKDTFGEQNVIQDPESGDFFLIQDGIPKPVNKEGFSQAEFAELSGLIPEAVGTVIGGFAGGSSTGGIGALKGAIAGGAGGATLRQAASAAMGTPQVASAGERAFDIGLSAAIDAVTFGLGKIAGGTGKVFVSKLTGNQIRKGTKEAAEEGLEAIAKREGIPGPTLGQLSKASSPSKKQEKILAQIDFSGSKIRKTFDDQRKKVIENLEKNVKGNFIDTEMTLDSAGKNVKDVIEGTVNGIKEESSALFNSFNAQGSQAFVPTKIASERFRKFGSALGVIDNSGQPLKYNPETFLTPDAFDELQGVLLNLDQKFFSQPGEISLSALNTLRQSIDDKIDWVNPTQKDTILQKIRSDISNLTREMIDNIGDESLKPGLKNTLDEANSLWAKQIDLTKKARDIGLNIKDPSKSVADEKFLNKVFLDTKNIGKFKDIVGDDVFNKASENFLTNFFRKRARDGVSAAKILTGIEDNIAVFRQILPKKRLKSIKDNLTFLKELDKPVNASYSGIVNLLTNPLEEFKGYMIRGKLGLKKMVKELPETTEKTLDRATRAAGLTEGRSQKREAIDKVKRRQALK